MPQQRLQHPGFGTEIRALLTSAKQAEREFAGALVDEIDAMTAARLAGQLHPKEDCLHGQDLSKIHYLKLYTSGRSIRVYFAMVAGDLWMLGLDVKKRRTKLTPGMTAKLLERLRWVQKETGND